MKTTSIVGRLTLVCLFSLAAAAMWSACGDDETAAPGGGGNGELPAPSFVDCWVAGLKYVVQTTPPTSGSTETGGTFNCPNGQTVTFKVGDIVLGEGVAGPCLNPIEITGATDEFEYEPTNVARLLQTLDDDGLLSNGIVIIEAVHTVATGRTLNFNRHPDAFGNDANVQQLISDMTAVTAAGTRPLVETAAARAHLRSTMLIVLSGEYDGSFDGSRGDVPWTGHWEIDVAHGGTIVGRFEPRGGEAINMSGDMQANGTFTCSDQAAVGLWFSGRIVRNEWGLHDVVGSWNDYEQGSGSFEGSRSVYTTTYVCP